LLRITEKAHDDEDQGPDRTISTTEFCSDDHHGPHDGNLLTLPPDSNVLT